jgi:16S rRNA (cytosine967-C5)-methyltransferase
VLAKRADMRWRRTLEQLQELVALQDELLDAAAVFVKPGGLLVYSTCRWGRGARLLGPGELRECFRQHAAIQTCPGTASPTQPPYHRPPLPRSIEEDEGLARVQAFLQRTAGAEFELEPAPSGLLPAGVEAPPGVLATLPHVHGVDGAFAARLRRRRAR